MTEEETQKTGWDGILSRATSNGVGVQHYPDLSEIESGVMFDDMQTQAEGPRQVFVQLDLCLGEIEKRRRDPLRAERPWHFGPDSIIGATAVKRLDQLLQRRAIL